MQAALRPLAESAGNRGVTLRAERGSELGYELLPLAISRSAWKLDDPRHANRKSKRPPQRRLLSARIETLCSVSNSRWLDTSFLPDALKVFERERARLTRQRVPPDVTGSRETENLADLVLAVSTLRHRHRLYDARCWSATYALRTGYRRCVTPTP